MPTMAQWGSKKWAVSSKQVVAREGLARHSGRIASRDVIGIAEFAAPSRKPRFTIMTIA